MPPRDALDKELKRSIFDTIHMLEELKKADGNESTKVVGYEILRHEFSF